MSARVEIDEINGGGVLTHGVVNLNVGSIDTPNLVVGPRTGLLPGQNAFRKYNRLHFLDLDDASRVRDITVWKSSGDYRDGETIQTNLATRGAYPYLPTTTNKIAPTRDTYKLRTMPVVKPEQPNLGINGSMAGSLVIPGYSDVFIWQTQLSANTKPGVLRTKEFSFYWLEEPFGGPIPAQVTDVYFESVSETEISVAWAAATNADSYEIWRSISGSGGEYTRVGTTEATLYFDTALVKGEYTYWYKICGISSYGAGDYSIPIGVNVYSEGAPAAQQDTDANDALIPYLYEL